MNKTILHWSYLNFKDVPIDLSLYEQLEEVYLKENFISVIPKWLLNITTLKFISLEGNNLAELPVDIYFLENLEYLDVSHNELKELPKTIGLMLKLETLNVSGNQLTNLPTEIGNLHRLEGLDVAKNQLTSLPLQLSECVCLRSLNLSDNEHISHIPERISNLPALHSLAADHCSLLYLPATFSKLLGSVRIFHNRAVTYIPMIYERFYQSFYDNRQQPAPINSNISKTNFFWVEELENHTRLLLPFGTCKIFPVPSAENRITLYDDCIHALQNVNRAIPVYEYTELHNILPEPYMSEHVNNGAIACCTHSNCSKPLYTSYYLMIVRRIGSSSKQLFTCNFCTIYCANQWLSSNYKKYYQLDWRICNANKN